MTIIEALCKLKDKRGLTNQQVSDVSGVPLGTVNRILSGQTDNPGFQNVYDIATALGASLDELTGLKKPDATAPTADDKLIALYERELQRKDKWMKILFGCLAFIFIAVLFVLVYDITHPTMGYVRY